MTTPRRDGGGSLIGEWFRSNHNLDSVLHSLVVGDIDWSFHRYRTCVDGVGTREVRLMMDLETKCFGRDPTDSQRETQFIRHQHLATKRWVVGIGRDRVRSWNFGQFYLRLSGEVPEDGQLMDWGSFESDGSIRWQRIPSVELLEQILRFDRRPDDPSRLLSLRRHHKTTAICTQIMLPLGFETTQVVLSKS